MKKTILLLGITLSAATVAQAQWITGGPELGLNLSNIASKTGGEHNDGGIRPGLKVGGVVDINFNDMFAIQPGLFYSMQGAHVDNTDVVTRGNTTTTSIDKFDYRIDYLQIPVNFQFKFGDPKYGQFFVGAGPYIGFALGGRVTNETGTSTTNAAGTTTSTDRKNTYTLNIGNNAATDDVKTVDAGLNFNLGYQFNNGLFVRGNAGLGLVNIEPGGDDNNYMRNWGFGFSAGYTFGY